MLNTKVVLPINYRVLLLSLGLAWACLPVWAQSAGEVEFSRGVGFAQTPGQTPRTLGKGLALKEGDRLTTSDSSTAIVRLQDGTRMTVRPNSDIVLQQYRFKENADDNSMVLQLLRGGFRALTGLISKNAPNAARIKTSTATIGIRGTDFDARLCSKDCGVESARVNERARPNAILASARIVASRGDVVAIDPVGQRRRLVDGGSVYPGDVVETGASTQAMLAFRDESRVVLGASTKFRVDSFIYDTNNAGEGRFLVSLLKGSVRALSGLIGKSNNRNVRFSTATATIGIRGTEFSVRCTGECAGEAATAGDGLTVFTYAGEIGLKPDCALPETSAGAGSGVSLDQCATQPLKIAPIGDIPSPSFIDVPVSLFFSDTVEEDREGLYLFVRDGHIEINTNSGVLHLGRGETGFANDSGLVARPGSVPRFMDFDRTPLPGSRNPGLISVLGDAGIRPVAQCR
jgi:hypothetical protein